MAWTTPTTQNPGDAILASLWNAQVKDNLLEFADLFLSNWISYTPTVDQGTTKNITNTATARYIQVGNLVLFRFAITITGPGAAGQELIVSYPNGIQPLGATEGPFGIFQIYDSSTNISYLGTSMASGTYAQRFNFQGDWSGNAMWGVTPNLAVANGDLIRGLGFYPAAP